MYKVNETHDPSLKSWVAAANQQGNDFPIQNLPFAILRRANSDEAFRGAIAIGDQVVDLKAVAEKNIFSGAVQEAISIAGSHSSLNPFMDLGNEAWSKVRLAFSHTLREGAKEQAQLETCLIAMDKVQYSMPCVVGDYTDYYTSIHHATRVGSLFRPDNPLLPNYKWVPIAYHGRSSSLDVSGQEFHRPYGQIKGPDMDEPVFAACKRLDYELEMAIFIGQGNELGQPISIDKAEEHVFGISLFNDWSARDIQAWEYQPLGPFLAKNFASTVSPWVVTMEALAPFRSEFTRPDSDPQPLEYLSSKANRQMGALDISLQVLLQTQSMQQKGEQAEQISQSNFKDSYWTVAQMVTHHTVNGCNLNPGDCLGSGTQSGPEQEEAGSLLELTMGGKQALNLKNGETRTFLEDGDTVILKGQCQRQGFNGIGFGEVTSTVLPAKPLEQVMG